MLALIKLIQQIVSSLNSEGTPGQVAAGIALGSALGLTPLLSLHNLVIFAAAMLLNVSFPGFMLGWALFVPLGFLLDPLFDVLGRALLLDATGLHSLWTTWYNTPVLGISNFNNTVTLGSFIVWAVCGIPFFFLFRFLVTQYRERLYATLQRTRVFQAVTASKAYNLYRLLRP